MANTIRIKRRASGGSSGAPASLANAELAYSEVDQTLFIGEGTGGDGGSASTIVPIGGPGTFAKLASPALTGTPTAPTAAADTDTTQVATTAYVLGQASSSTPVMNGSAAAGTSKKYSRADHVHGSDTSKADLASPTFTGTPAAPTAAADTDTTQLATTAYVIGQAASATPAALGSAAVGTSKKYARGDHVHAMPALSALGAATADVSLAGYKITSLGTPTADTDAATKAYVDTVAQGLDAKQSVRAATTASITLSGEQTIDGVSVVAGDRVLVKNQSSSFANGIYVASASTWARATDADSWIELVSAFVFVEQGTTNGDSGWVCSVDAGGTLGSTSVTWTQFSSAGTYTAGDGLTLSGSTFNVGGTTNRISVSADAVDIASTYVGQSSITTLGTIGTGTWQGSTVAVSYGGTGATTLTGLIKGNGTSAFTAAVAGTDYLSPTSDIDGGSY